MNEILGLVGTVCICGAFYLMARKEKEKSERLQNRVSKLENENHDFWTANLKKNKEIKELKQDILKLHEIQEFDNKVMKGRMEQIGDLQEDIRKEADRFAKDQITIAGLNHELCEANYRVVELESEIDSMEHRGWRKIMRARRLS